MKLSILLPTRNRLDLLRGAIETVRRQDAGNWEIVVSDNASDEDVAGYVASLGDVRIAVHRTERFLPVTENWNRALERSSGDYVLMLGDDDGLLPGYVANLQQLVERFGAPDVVYTSALLLTSPGVVPELPDGQLSPYGYASFLRGSSVPFVLDRAVAHEMVRAAMDFRLTYGYNSQFLALSRRLVEEVAPTGPFYQSRFPDYYSTNVAFLTARSIVVDPSPRVVIGVSPKSYGFFHENKREGEGRAFLGGSGDADAELDHISLPGSNINVGWLSAVEAIARCYGARFGLRVNRRRFRLLQSAHVYEERFVHERIGDADLAALEARLRPRERRLYRLCARLARGGARVLPKRLQHAFEYAYRRALRQFPRWDPHAFPGRYASVLDVFEAWREPPVSADP
jgi:glycosyltransferase involved in cell wall biosynthesis